MLFVEAAVSCVLILLTFLLNLTIPSIPADAFPRLFLLVSNCLWITLVLFLGGRMRARDRMQNMKSGIKYITKRCWHWMGRKMPENNSVPSGTKT